MDDEGTRLAAPQPGIAAISNAPSRCHQLSDPATAAMRTLSNRKRHDLEGKNRITIQQMKEDRNNDMGGEPTTNNNNNNCTHHRNERLKQNVCSSKWCANPVRPLTPIRKTTSKFLFEVPKVKTIGAQLLVHHEVHVKHC